MTEPKDRTIEKAFTVSLARAEAVTLDITVMDRSTSMEVYGTAPEEALNAHREGLAKAPTAPHITMAVFGFSDKHIPDVVLKLTPVMRAPAIALPHAHGNTRLYGTVLDILKVLARACDDLGGAGIKQNVILTVYTDGDDNRSRDLLDDLRRESKKARERGWELCIFGFGVDAQRIARDMGFRDDAGYARTMPTDKESIYEATETTTLRTVTSSLGGLWRSRPITMPLNEDTPPPSTPH